MVSPSDLTGVTKPKSLYAKREPVFPKAVDGRFRRLKWAIMAITLTIYYVTPWLRWDRGAWAPDQAVLIDLAGRRFYMFGIEIWPHEFYYVAGLLIMAGVGLFLVTSAVGRAWCGYACPQTVWTDLFQHVDRLIDGDRNAQIRLQNAPWTASKIARRSLKYTVYLAISLATGGAWIFYFADAPTLARDFATGNAAFVAYATVAILTATTFLLAGFLREQVCIYMCPWPRIQTAMLDEKSLIVTYKDWRGEPRKRGTKKATLEDLKLGDCIDCNQCVAVCPTGIDIRNGPQVGCITCALCIDACDKVMAQVGRPRGLIDYATFEDAKAEKAGETPKPVLKTLLRPRTILYFALWAAIGLGMLFALGERTRLDISAQQQRNPVYVRLSDGTIRNAFTVKIRNMETRPRRFAIGLEGLSGATMWLETGARDRADRTVTAEVAPDALGKFRIFVIAPPGEETRDEFAFTVRALDPEGGSDSTKAVFERP
ncbi:cytochrome c oxidase accessory protein CcoG [Sphingosinicella sp. BN140058]|uniref:cytochrome c oxidase accessory protein CcoG n=1 Tax=Sphingosinicella sp. BN140058 TaxID=1892855 RepID=UPI0010138B0E|nr:cytochrome c oxidase accessory protein CcoG [Sphingosinicella sp. BN140058]QAY78728.1 cytochrome c oxidase accessory protein CcoG [Sphingosinicella sp. BN140058]